MTTKKNPPKWINVYPQGTKEGNEEQKMFISLARHPKYEWRSISALSAESGLSKKRVEEILSKYYNKGMIFQNPKNEEQWGYWERVPQMLKDDNDSIVQKEQNNRIDGIVKDPAIWTTNGSFPTKGKCCPSGGGCSNCSPSKVDYAIGRWPMMRDAVRVGVATIEVLPGAENLGEVDDIEYFRKKLFNQLKLPKEIEFDKGDKRHISLIKKKNI